MAYSIDYSHAIYVLSFVSIWLIFGNRIILKHWKDVKRCESLILGKNVFEIFVWFCRWNCLQLQDNIIGKDLLFDFEKKAKQPICLMLENDDDEKS